MCNRARTGRKDVYAEASKESRLGCGDVYAFQNGTAELNVFVIDMYQDKTNQIDFVALAFRSDEASASAVSRHLRAFF